MLQPHARQVRVGRRSALGLVRGTCAATGRACEGHNEDINPNPNPNPNLNPNPNPNL